MEKRWLSVKETADYLGLHFKSIYRLTTKRLIPFVRVSGIGIRIDKFELDTMLQTAEELPAEFETKTKKSKNRAVL